MSRAVQLAGALGGAALLGAGVMPFLDRPGPPERWFEIGWSRSLDEDAVIGLLRHLAASRRPQHVVFEIQAERGKLTYLVGTSVVDAGRLEHLFRSFLPDVLLTPAERPTMTVSQALAVRLGSRERALRVNAASEIARAIAGALAGTTGTTILQWHVGKRLTPSHVARDSIGLPTTSRALGQAFLHGLAPLESGARRDLQAKVGERGFGTALWIATTIKDTKAARSVLHAVIGGIRVAEAAGVPLNARRTDPASVSTAQPPRRLPLSINVLELIGLLAWPLGDTNYPGVLRLASKRLPVPNAVARNGRVVGDGNHPSTNRPVTLPIRDALMHTHVLGPTGVGKSTLLANLALQDIEAGRSVVVVEPKGDLVADLLPRIPRNREQDVVILDPADETAPVGLNPLAYGSPELVTDQILAVFKGLYRDYLGPRTTDVLHAALLTLAHAPQASLVALPMLLTDARLRRELTAALRDDLALGPFWAWYENLSEPERQQVIGPVMNKVRPFLFSKRTRHVLGQPQPRFDLRSLFTERRIVLVPLRKGVLGGEAAGLVGSLLVAQLWHAAQARASIEPERRHPVSVYIDEFQDFLHLPTDLADVLAQARGLGVALTLAHQHLAQLTPDIRAAVLANARSRICFRLSTDDAAVIARSTELLDGTDFTGLGRYEVYAALVADGASQPFCSATTRALPDVRGDGDRLRTLSRERYGVDVQTIEDELRALWQPRGNERDGTIGARRRHVENDGGEQ